METKSHTELKARLKKKKGQGPNVGQEILELGGNNEESWVSFGFEAKVRD